MRSNNIIFIINVFISATVNAYLDLNVPDGSHTFDQNLYENVLDPELCEEQMNYIVNNDTALRIQFLDAGIRTPRGIITGNLVDLGNYYQCLGISEEIPNSVVHGKYCMITVPLDQELQLPSLPEWPEWPEFPWPELNPETRLLSNETIKKLKYYNVMRSGAQVLLGTKDERSTESSLSSLSFRLAVCIPKSCTTKQALNKLFFNVTSLGLEYQDNFCRLPNDKQWVAADYVAAGVFSLIGLLTILSTFYDLRHTVLLGKDPKKVNKIYQSFSVYTNTRRLVSYTPVPGALECLDGIRSLAMMWVIIGHTFVTQLSGIMANPLETFEWITSLGSLWITTAPITVDTFFMLSGLLLVYTTTGKITRMKLVKNIHLFYLNRLLRMFPVLAAAILLQASLFNRVTDGPNWSIVVRDTNRCRVYWWSTLLHIQNYVNPAHICLSHSWYLAIDVQLHILSPLVLFWVLGGKKRVAWIALIAAMLISLTAASVYNFIMEFPSGPVIPSRLNEQNNYLSLYYVNTLTRASPFFVGMIYGYLLHLHKGKNMIMSKLSASILWVCAIAIGSTVIYSAHPIMQLDWDNQTVDSIINSFMRPAWALAVGWLIFACVHGYGGPVNWILSLHMWKILGRLSYAMYIVHYPIIFVVNSTALAPTFFSVHFSVFKFLGDFFLAVIVAFIVTILVDSPFSVLIKHFMGGGPRRPGPPAVTDYDKTKKEDILENNNDYVRSEAKTRL